MNELEFDIGDLVTADPDGRRCDYWGIILDKQPGVNDENTKYTMLWFMRGELRMTEQTTLTLWKHLTTQKKNNE